MDVLFVAGLKSAVDQLAAIAGRAARPSISTDLLVLSAGMLLGFLAGEVVLPLGIGSIGLGYAGGLFLAGVLVSSIAPRLGIVGSTPSAARGIVEELGLVAFVAIVALDAGEAIVWRMSGDLAAKVAIAGFVAAVLPPLLVWAYAHHVLRMNPAVLLGCIAGTYSQYEAARESAREIGSSVPWIGFPVANAIAATIVVMLGYAAAMA
jgi:putative transport protein